MVCIFGEKRNNLVQPKDSYPKIMKDNANRKKYGQVIPWH